MTLEIPVKPLKEALLGFGRIIPRNPTLPSLASVRFQAQAGSLCASATDLDQYAHYRFDVPYAKREAFVLGLKDLTTLAQADSDSRLLFEPMGPNQASVTRQVAGQAIKSTVELMDPAEWPDAPKTTKTEPVSDAFLENLRRLLPFASKEDQRPVLKSVFLDVSQADHHMVATDGRRLPSLNTVSLPFKTGQILPVKKFLTWSKLAGPVALGLAKLNEATWLQVEAGPWTYLAKTMEGTYPNWRQVVPDGNGRHVITLGEEDVSLMRKAFAALASVEKGASAIRFRAINGKLKLGHRSEDQADWTELDLPNTRYEGPDSTITVDKHYLLEALEAGFRKFNYEDECSPMHATDPQGGIHVLMPIRTGAIGSAPEPTPEPAPAAPIPAPIQSTTPTPHRKEHAMPEHPQSESSALDRLLAAFEAAKMKLRETQAALSEIATAVKEAVREDRQRQAEIVAVRAGLQKLQAIRV